MMKPRRLPRIGKENNNIQNNNTQKNTTQLINNKNPKTRNKINKEDELINNNTDPDFIKRYRKLRNRHQEDFAISIVPNKEDIISEDAKLYDNKYMNLEKPPMKEIGLDNTEFYIESIHHDQYYKINQIKKEENLSRKNLLL